MCADYASSSSLSPHPSLLCSLPCTTTYWWIFLNDFTIASRCLDFLFHMQPSSFSYLNFSSSSLFLRLIFSISEYFPLIFLKKLSSIIESIYCEFLCLFSSRYFLNWSARALTNWLISPLYFFNCDAISSVRKWRVEAALHLVAYGIEALTCSSSNARWRPVYIVSTECGTFLGLVARVCWWRSHKFIKRGLWCCKEILSTTLLGIFHDGGSSGIWNIAPFYQPCTEFGSALIFRRA